MAGLKRCIGIDLGSHSVKIAEMAMDKGGLRVIRMMSAPLPVGPDALESERSSVMISTVRSLIKANKISTKNAVFSMPGQTIFQRRMRLPRAPGPRLRQIIQFEARQVIPFPLEKTALRYQIFDTEEEREVEVLLVAMKKETNQAFMRMIRRMGLRPVGIGVSTLSLFNGQELHRFKMEDWLASGGGSSGFLGLSKGKKKPKKAAKSKAEKKAEKQRKKKFAKKKKKGQAESEEIEDAVASEAAAPIGLEDDGAMDDFQDDLGMDMEFEEVRAFVDLGANTTDLAICKANAAKIVGFTRSIPFGGNHITKAIAKQGDIPFGEAEELKIKSTAVLSGEFEFDGDPEAYDDGACQAATAVCDRIIAELRRSMDYYISQSDGTAVDQIVLSGGGASLPFFAGYIEERVGIPVEISKTVGHDKIKCPSQYDENFDYAPYKVAIGLAMQGLSISNLDIDFLPDDVRSMRDFSGQYFEIALLAAMIGGMVFFGSTVGSRTHLALKTDIEGLESEIARLQPAKDASDAAIASRTGIAGKLMLIESNLHPRALWLRYVAWIHDIKPASILITKMNCWSDQASPLESKVTIDGEAQGQGVVIEFADIIKAQKGRRDQDHPLFIKDFAVVYFEARDSAYNNKPVYPFQFTLTVQDFDARLLTNILDFRATAERQLAIDRALGAATMGYEDDEYYEDEEYYEDY